MLIPVAFESATSLLRALRERRSVCVFEELGVDLLYKLRAASHFVLSRRYRHSHSRGAFAPLHAHTCCLRKRNQPLTRASRATSLSAFSKSLYNKKTRGDDSSCFDDTLLYLYMAITEYSLQLCLSGKLFWMRCSCEERLLSRLCR